MMAAFKWIFVLHIIGWGLAYIFNQSKFNLKKIVITVFGISGLLYYFFVSHLSSNEFNLFEYSLVITAAVAIGFLFFYQKIIDYSRYELILVVLLYLAPFICSFGSIVYFIRCGQQYLFFWVILLAYMKIKSVTITKSIVFIIYFLIGILISFKIYNQVIINPYNQPPLSSNFVMFKYGNNKCLKLEINQAKYLNSLKDKLTYWSPDSKEVIGLYAMSGHILLAGYNNYYNPIIWDGFQWKYFKNKLSNDPLYKYKSMPILISKDLNSNQRDLLEGYKKVDSLKSYKDGYIYIFKPLSRNDTRMNKNK